MRVTRKVFVNRNADVVFGYLASPANEPLWRASILHAGADEPGELGIGATGRSLIRFMGREVDVRWEIVEFEQEARLSREYASGVRGGRDRYMLQAFGLGATIVKAEVEVEVAGLMGLLTTSRRTSMEHELRTDLQRLKSILEDR
ncbi:MAG: SRPBCC family protein [bacterium]|nr:SRPBCC family protein [bacterium]MDE0290031.1 SRPBCC family protein [bacterium]MDE0439546.1 SRPBCC family protein [bacterium]